jgi:hypothetical protein
MRNLGWTMAGLGVLAALGGSAALQRGTSSPCAAPRSDLAAPRGLPPAEEARARATLAALPLRFDENRGQVDPAVKFVHRAPGCTLFLTPSEAVFDLAGPEGRAVVRTRLEGGSPEPAMTGEEEQGGKTNYLHGSDPARWTTGVPGFGRVRCADVYPGIDLVYHGTEGVLEYDFVVAPGADPGRIALAVEGADSVAIDPRGDLVLETAAGTLRQHAPVAYQEVAGGRREVTGRYAVRADGSVGFEVGAYDAASALVIDPTLSWASYLGGNGKDLVLGIAMDADGNVFVAGGTQSDDFPTTSAYQGAFGGIVIHDSEWFGDAFVTKINAAGTALVWSTYLGGSDDDAAYSVAVDAAGDAYVCGKTRSADFPVPMGSIDATWANYTDGWAAKLGHDGSTLAWSTYLGGQGGDEAFGIAVDGSGNAYVTGETNSGSSMVSGEAGFPVANQIPNAVVEGYGAAFVTKINATGTGILWSSRFGEDGNYDRGYAVRADSTGNCYVAGMTNSSAWPVVGGVQASRNGPYDAFLMKINPAGSALTYSTYLGGSDTDIAYALDIDAAGAAYLAGRTLSTDFPTTPGAFQERTFTRGWSGFVAKVDPAGSALAYSTYLGSTSGSGEVTASGIAVDGSGSAYVTGVSWFAGPFPTLNAFQDTNNGSRNGFVAKLNASGSGLVYSTYIGGSTNTNDAADTYSSKPFSGCIAVDASGIAAIGGCTEDTDFPVTGGAFATTAPPGINGFVAKVHPLVPPGTPTDLGATVVSSSRIDLAWAAGAGDAADTLALERSIDGTEFSALATLPGGTTAYSDTGLDPARTCAYRLRATNDAGTSDWAGPVEAATPATLGLGDLRGKLQNRAEEERDSFTAKGTLAFTGSAPDAICDAVEDGLEITFGAPDSPSVVTIPAGADGWKVRDGKYSWKSAKHEFPKVRVVLDFHKGKFQFAAGTLDLHGNLVGPVRIEVRCGDDAAAREDEWTMKKPGILVYAE